MIFCTQDCHGSSLCRLLLVKCTAGRWWRFVASNYDLSIPVPTSKSGPHFTIDDYSRSLECVVNTMPGPFGTASAPFGWMPQVPVSAAPVFEVFWICSRSTCQESAFRRRLRWICNDFTYWISTAATCIASLDSNPLYTWVHVSFFPTQLCQIRLIFLIKLSIIYVSIRFYLFGGCYSHRRPNFQAMPSPATLRWSLRVPRR